MAAAKKGASILEADAAKKVQRRNAIRSKFSDVANTIVGIQRAARNTLSSRIQRVQDLRAEGRRMMLSEDYVGAATSLETAWEMTWDSWLQRNPQEQDKVERLSQTSSASTAAVSRRSSLAPLSGSAGGQGDVEQGAALPDAAAVLLRTYQQVPPASPPGAGAAAAGGGTATEPEANIPLELSKAYARCQDWEGLDRLMGQALQMLGAGAGAGAGAAGRGGVPEGLGEEQELRWVKLMVMRGAACACRGPEHYRRAERCFALARLCRPRDRAAAMGLQTLRFLQAQGDAAAPSHCAAAAVASAGGALAALAVA